MLENIVIKIGYNELTNAFGEQIFHITMDGEIIASLYGADSVRSEKDRYVFKSEKLSFDILKEIKINKESEQIDEKKKKEPKKESKRSSEDMFEQSQYDRVQIGGEKK